MSNSLPDKGNRSWKVITEPTVEPCTVAELKTFARIDGSDEDTLLEGFIKAARLATEEYLGRYLIEQEVRCIFDFWYSEEIELPRPPLISVTKIATLDEDDTETEYSSSNYYVITEDCPGRVILKQGVTPPTNTERDYGGYKIEYSAGYGSQASDVPASITEAIKLWATAIYENRAVTGEPPPEARPLLDMYRVIKY